MKSRDGKSKRREEKRRRTKIKKRKSPKKEWFVAPEGRKVGSLKRRVRSHVVRWEMKSCTPMWREAHLQVKKLKTPHVRSTFRSCDVEKVHAVVARSTFRSQNVQSTPFSEHFWKLRCRKSARRSGAKHIAKSKSTKHQRASFGRSRCRFAGQAQGIVHLVKSEQNVRVL